MAHQHGLKRGGTTESEQTVLIRQSLTLCPRHEEEASNLATIPFPSDKTQHYSLKFSSGVKGCESNERRLPVEGGDDVPCRYPFVPHSLGSRYSVIRIDCQLQNSKIIMNCKSN